MHNNRFEKVIVKMEVADEPLITNDVEPKFAKISKIKEDIEDLSKYEIIEVSKSIFCDSCSILCDTEADLEHHKKTIHVLSTDKPSNSKQTKRTINHFCESCSKKTSACTCILNRDFSCYFPHCDKKFSTPTSLEIHQQLHNGLKPYICNVCNRSFPYASHLKQHKNIHEAANRFFCDKCNLPFTEGRYMEEHKRRVHLEETDSIKKTLLLNKSRQLLKPYSCNQCSFSFNTQLQLQSHKNIHLHDSDKFKVNRQNNPRTY